MNKILIILLLLVFTNVKSVCSQYDSAAIKKSLHLQPTNVVNLQGDTAYYLRWIAFDVDRSDTSSGINTYVMLLNKFGKIVYSFNCYIPAVVSNTWCFDPKPIDDFILSQNPRLKRKTQ